MPAESTMSVLVLPPTQLGSELFEQMQLAVSEDHRVDSALASYMVSAGLAEWASPQDFGAYWFGAPVFYLMLRDSVDVVETCRAAAAARALQR